MSNTDPTKKSKDESKRINSSYKTPAVLLKIRVITKLLNTEKSSKGKGKTHKSTNRQTDKTGKPAMVSAEKIINDGFSYSENV